MPGPVIIDIDGKKLSAEDAALLSNPMVGGVIIFFKNVESPTQLAELTDSILKINPSIGIFIDREGGNVLRLTKSGFSCWPAARYYGINWDDPEIGPAKALRMIERDSENMSKELAKYNISYDLAPVVDLDSDSDVIGGIWRAYHDDPQVVSALAAAFIKGFKKTAGMHVALKHFPDHGICKGDSHTTKPVSDKTLEELQRHHLIPYLKLAKVADAIMPAHITFTKIDPDNPVGYSKIWLDMLRRDYGFEGIIMSDCLSMAGADVGEMSTRALKALTAGCDMIIMANQSRAILRDVLAQLNTHYQISQASQLRIAKYLTKPISTQESTPEANPYNAVLQLSGVVQAQNGAVATSIDATPAEPKDKKQRA